MKKYSAHKSSLFLIELIIAIAFFTLASAVCLRLFVTSHLLSRETTDLNAAVNLAVSAAETFRNCSGDRQTLETLLPELKTASESGSTDTRLCAYYGEDSAPCEKNDALYTLSISLSQDCRLVSALIQVMQANTDTLLYELPVQVYVPNTFSTADAG